VTKQAKKAHPHAEIFALHEGQPLWDLADRIKKNGLREPIVTLDDLILDGRRRELACYRAGVAPKYRKFGSRKEDGDDPLEFVIDTNLHRRHLGDGERALAAARYATAKGGLPKTAQNIEESGNDKPAQVAQVSTNADAADKFDVPESKVRRGKAIVANGTANLQSAVADGTVTISDAAAIANEEPEIQDAAIEALESGKVKSVKAGVNLAKQTTPESVKDVNGDEVPDKALQAFEDAKEIGTLCREIDGIIAKVEAMGSRPGGRMLHTTSQTQTLKNVRKSLWQGRATHVCPYCRGVRNCDSCKSSGWTTKAFYDQAPETMREKK
jgi:hypothetical protein